ncbi:charged multivesicular body protein 6 isoform X1 [Corapipo altera]|uniref:charged multivesicular body protein 6 isoform X1 n=1 Tax=Corapipo altera TaxID=415028 RepID=UPI000FD62DD1|nr:charged multivesicular body protein 6 isoform X1 [Corapipo altera]
MGNLFGRKRRSRVTEQDRAVLQLKQQRDKLRQYQKRLSLGLERERALARQLLKDGKKEKAMLLLKKKRYQEQLLDKTENQISNLERMVQDIEFTQIEMKVIEGLKIGNECLNKMHQVMSIEEVERIIGETQDAVEYQRQIDELLAGSLTEEDEDAILEELNTITQEQLELPEVPSEPLPEKIPGTLSLQLWLPRSSLGPSPSVQLSPHPRAPEAPLSVPSASGHSLQEFPPFSVPALRQPPALRHLVAL